MDNNLKLIVEKQNFDELHENIILLLSAHKCPINVLVYVKKGSLYEIDLQNYFQIRQK